MQTGTRRTYQTCLVVGRCSWNRSHLEANRRYIGRVTISYLLPIRFDKVISINVHSWSKVMGFFFKCIFDVSINDNLRQAFNMTFVGCSVVIVRNFIYLWLFVAFRRPFKASKIWKMRCLNTCNWDSVGGYFNVHNSLIWEFKSFLFYRIELMLGHKIIVCVIGFFK